MQILWMPGMSVSLNAFIQRKIDRFPLKKQISLQNSWFDYKPVANYRRKFKKVFSTIISN